MADKSRDRGRLGARRSTATKRKTTTRAKAERKRSAARTIAARKKAAVVTEALARELPDVDEATVTVDEPGVGPVTVTVDRQRDRDRRDVTGVREEVRLEPRATPRSRVEERPVAGRRTARWWQGRPVRERDITAFLRQLIMLLEAGTPLLRSLHTLETRSEREGVREMVHSMREYVEAGNPLWQAFAREDRYFSPVMINMIKASEASGTLTIVLERIVEFRERRELMVRRIRSAAFYPVVLILVAFIVITIIAAWVIPQFKMIFRSFELEETGITAFFFGAAAALAATWWIILLVVFALVLAYYLWFKRSPVRRTYGDRFRLRLPIVGPIIKKTAVVEFTRTFGLMLRSGLSMLVTLDLCRNAMSNRAYVHVIQDMRDSVERGEGLERPLRQAEKERLFPGTVVDMLITGEETGQLDVICQQIANRYEEEVRIQVDTIGEALQPIIVIVLGIVVAGLAVAIFGPLVQMIEKISTGAGV
ncbi:MAG: type II secretion system F family protein [Candidatus Hydrogenedentales bacterium]